MLKLFLKILKDEFGGTLSITRKTSGTVATAAAQNSNADEIEAVVNGAIEAANIANDAVTAVKLNSDVVRADYGLKQHTDGTLYVDPSDTNPCLEVTDGGVRAKVDSVGIERASGGLQLKDGGISTAKLANDAVTADKIADDITLNSFLLTPAAAPDANYEIANKKYVDDAIATGIATKLAVSVLDYGTSTSASTERGIAGSTLKIAYGYTAVTGSVGITNLPFTSSTSYIVVATIATNVNADEVIHALATSGSGLTIVQANNKAVYWFAIGI